MNLSTNRMKDFRVHHVTKIWRRPAVNVGTVPHRHGINKTAMNKIIVKHRQKMPYFDTAGAEADDHISTMGRHRRRSVSIPLNYLKKKIGETSKNIDDEKRPPLKLRSIIFLTMCIQFD